MKEESSDLFIEALHENSITKMILMPKSDLHNHVGRGGNIAYLSKINLSKIKGSAITPPREPFDSLSDMQKWYVENIIIHFPGTEGYLKRVEASFVQAAEDNIHILSMSYGIDEITTLGGIESFINIMNSLHMQFAPNSKFYPELVLQNGENIDYELDRLEAILSYGWFKSVDWFENELTRDVNAMKPLFRKAKEKGLKLRAHAGEFGDADCIRKCVEELELNEVHHGITAVNSKNVMCFLSDNKIQLNLCPTSNIMLKRSKSYASYQIRQLIDNGIAVTINTDDLLIFNATVSQEYLNLYNSKVITDIELDSIRMTGLNDYTIS